MKQVLLITVCKIRNVTALLLKTVLFLRPKLCCMLPAGEKLCPEREVYLWYLFGLLFVCSLCNLVYLGVIFIAIDFICCREAVTWSNCKQNMKSCFWNSKLMLVSPASTLMTCGHCCSFLSLTFALTEDNE